MTAEIDDPVAFGELFYYVQSFLHMSFVEEDERVVHYYERLFFAVHIFDERQTHAKGADTAQARAEMLFAADFAAALER